LFQLFYAKLVILSEKMILERDISCNKLVARDDR